jgi:DNA-directed RNA polymerase subunit alpha
MKNNQPTIVTPSQPIIVSEGETKGVYEIDGLYPGYGHTLGNSIRRIILSSLPGAAITTVKIEGVNHEFSTLEGVKEDVITMLLNVRKMRMRLHAESPQTLMISKKGEGVLRAADVGASNSAVEIVNPDQHIATLTDKKASIDMELTVERGLGFVTKDELKKEKVSIGTIALDAVFTPIRRVSYEVENMRVGDRTDFNKLIISIETDGTLSPREALEQAIHIMIEQLKAVVGFREEEKEESESELYDVSETGEEEITKDAKDVSAFLKTSIEEIGLSTRTARALSNANVRTVSGLIRKSEEDLLSLEGLGDKGVQEIKDILAEHDLSPKEK